MGSVIEEFTEIESGASVPSVINAKRVVPEKSEDIVVFAKQRNPFNHPSVMYKKADVLLCRELSGCSLYARLLSVDVYADCRF